VPIDSYFLSGIASPCTPNLDTFYTELKGAGTYIRPVLVVHHGDDRIVRSISTIYNSGVQEAFANIMVRKSNCAAKGEDGRDPSKIRQAAKLKHPDNDGTTNSMIPELRPKSTSQVSVSRCFGVEKNNVGDGASDIFDKLDNSHHSAPLPSRKATIALCGYRIQSF